MNQEIWISPTQTHFSVTFSLGVTIRMKCLNCNQDLLMTERQGIEIDYCNACRGVWLDRGELDKFIQLSTQRVPGNAPNDGDDIGKSGPAYGAPRYSDSDKRDTNSKEYKSRDSV